MSCHGCFGLEISVEILRYFYWLDLIQGILRVSMPPGLTKFQFHPINTARGGPQFSPTMAGKGKQ